MDFCILIAIYIVKPTLFATMILSVLATIVFFFAQPTTTTKGE